MEIVSDIILDMKALQWIGIGLSPENGYSLYLSLIQLSNQINAKSTRFWGKIYGKKSDYYIAETIIDFNEEEDHDKNAELSGANKYTYYVCSQSKIRTLYVLVGQNWIKLPDVLPEQIIAARKIKRYFSGDLDSYVYGHPPYQWKEKEYLRCQIARISASTVIVPDGQYKIADGEDPFLIELVPEEEATKPEIDALTGLGSWVHLYYELNKIGRTKPKRIINEDNEEVDDPDGPEVVPALTSIESEEESWTIRTYPHVGQNVTPSIVSLKSERWLGAYAVFTGGRTTNIYMGYGIKTTEDNYSPEPPLPTMKEYSNPVKEEFTLRNIRNKKT